MSVPRTFPERIPGLPPGILFCILLLVAPALPARADPLALPAALLAEEDWPALRIEARRLALAPPTPEAGATARLWEGIACIRLRRTADAADLLAPLWRDPSAPPGTRCLAAYEWGRAAWTNNPSPETEAALDYAFRATRDPLLFWRAGCSLRFYLQSNPAARDADPARWQLLELCRDAWPDAVWKTSNPRTGRWGPAATSFDPFQLPGKWIVRFYRTQISPAIGSRCSLDPSCSEYFRLATRAHGLLAFPIVADRFAREPSVVSAGEVLVERPDGTFRYADPLEAHDYWMKAPHP